jgi:hypothetical protein
MSIVLSTSHLPEGTSSIPVSLTTGIYNVINYPLFFIAFQVRCVAFAIQVMSVQYILFKLEHKYSLQP